MNGLEDCAELISFQCVSGQYVSLYIFNIHVPFLFNNGILCSVLVANA